MCCTPEVRAPTNLLNRKPELRCDDGRCFLACTDTLGGDQLNGASGLGAIDFHLVDAIDPTTWRYTVKLDGGEAFKVKAASVRAEPEGGRRRGGVGEAAEGQRGH